jgi:thioredoxin-related protein
MSRMSAILLVGAALTLAACTDKPVETLPQIYTGFPEALDPRCRDGTAKIYDECGDQVALFSAALARANAENKILLVEYGAEWCIWCHVFNAYINGNKDRFRYRYASAKEPDAWTTRTFEEHGDVEGAEALREFVARHFVVVRIDAQYAPNGAEVLEHTGAAEHFPGGLPFVFTVDSRGRYAATFEGAGLEKNRRSFDWYRGFHRDAMLRVLTSMRNAALASRH